MPVAVAVAVGVAEGGATVAVEVAVAVGLAGGVGWEGGTKTGLLVYCGVGSCSVSAGGMFTAKARVASCQNGGSCVSP